MSAILTFLIQNPIIAGIALLVVIVLFIALLVSKKSFTLNFGENKSITIGGSNEKKSKGEGSKNGNEIDEEQMNKIFDEKLAQLDKRVAIIETQNKNTDMMLLEIKAAIVRVETFLMQHK